MNPANITSLFLLIVIGLLAGCMGGSPAPQDHYYRLDLEKASTKNVISLPYKTIGVAPGVTNGLYRDRAILYVDNQAPLELQQYHYHHWHDVPARLVQEHAINWLQHQIPKTRVVRLSRGEQSEVMLQTRLVRFERVLSGSALEVLVELEIILQKNYQPLHRKIYRQTVSIQGDTMHDTVQAFGDALTNIYEIFLNDINR